MKEFTIHTQVRFYQENELSHDDQELISAAREATKHSYAPYSKFYVGAALRLANQQIVCGSNQENAAYPSGTCAERTAIFYANAQYPEQPVEALAIAAQTNGKFLAQPISPCGSCRQVILETEHRFKKPIRILLYGTEGVYVLEGIQSILPLQFDQDCLL
ncbi:MAG: cytidine deaminase [Candidatus Paraprevotella stercoravium]|jgi:cytidine deaminase|uniref:Cytidine deaminase n=1 Tax=Candidatus Paraprevotella stercoravium TaxID=2838725 RepID=A0A9E2L8Z1_9BACT|nr:cytidine deaminase [Candidatus Paraprevotella stercoravium]